jgi:F-type H+-transporting ATPase subunit gamma
MASIKDLKKRIGTVKNTQQTTKAMKMVSAAKLRRAQEAIQNQRPYSRGILGLIRELSLACNGSDLLEKYPILRQEPTGATKKVLVLLVTSDRGLCGGFNGGVIKTCQKWLSAVSQDAGVSAEVAFVGRRGHDFFKNKKVKVAGYFPEAGGKVTFAKARKLADELVRRFLSGEVDEIKLIYNEFKNAASQTPLVEDFLPLKSDSASAEGGSGPSFNSIVKPSTDEVFGELLQKNFATQLFRVLLESQAGEHGARMSAMENATKNAGEMIRRLTLQYNKQRQAGITKELLEIISGSESQKS